MNLPILVTLGSFFNLPVIIGGKAVALVNIASSQKGLYGDAGTAVLYTIFNQVSVQAGKLVQVIENEKRRLSISNPVFWARLKREGGFQYSGTKIGSVKPKGKVNKLTKSISLLLCLFFREI